MYVRKHYLCGCCMCVPMYVTCQVVYAVCVFYMLYVHYTVCVVCVCMYVHVCARSSVDLETLKQICHNPNCTLCLSMDD